MFHFEETPPQGGFLFGWFPNEKPGGKGKKEPGVFIQSPHLEITQKGNAPGGGGSYYN